MEKVQANIIVFDQGNTLFLDPFATVIRQQSKVFLGICRRHGIEVKGSELIDAWTQANHETHYPFIGHFIQEEPIIQLALHKLGLQEATTAIVALELLQSYRIGLKKHILADHRTHEIREVVKTLNTLGKRLGVFSNDRRVGLGMVLQSMGVDQYFEYIETSESLGVEKPDQRVFQHMVTCFRATPGDIVYVGDDPVIDIDSAKKAGLKTIRYAVDAGKYSKPWRDYRRTSESEPDATVNDLNDLFDVIE